MNTDKCIKVKVTQTLACKDVDEIKYCKVVKKEEIICVPDGDDAVKRLSDVIRGLRRGK